jgi:hypothetical protein
VDGGGGRRVTVITYAMATFGILLRAASLGSPWLAVAANAAGALLMPMLMPTLGPALYNWAKASPCPLRFHMGTEGGWDVGAAGACFCAAALTASGASLAVPLLLALPAAAGVTATLWRAYRPTAPLSSP